ncbi:hypothetical protein B9Q02_12345 [Candidatus Marsarchaeota G1 archaeon BE_D]|jgi:Predicted solute binding protein|uniref:Uncharacterized protein n=1 Tax=Candidatus Marsarchaeota G1 archaeon BE_D TaxID=1978156 RepID=A0A2R6A6E0_9ARCH|nr:MAG: hypothetical protein B9Q02_12345 [Candidatus Marsarchaeota G1 archaeon BE_D]
MDKRLAPILAAVLIALSAFSFAPLSAGANTPQCVQPNSATASQVYTRPYNTPPINFSYAYFTLLPGECALFPFILVNATIQNGFFFYNLGSYANASGVQAWLIPKSELSTFFSTGQGYSAFSPNGNITLYIPTEKPNTVVYFYGVNKGNNVVEFVPSAAEQVPDPAAISPPYEFVGHVILPGQTLILFFNILAPFTGFYVTAAANASVTWTFTNNTQTLLSSTGFEINGTSFLALFQTTLKGQWMLEVSNTGSLAAFAAFDIPPEDQYSGYYVASSSPTASTTTSTTTTTTTTTSSTTSSTSTTTTTTSSTTSSTTTTTQHTTSTTSTNTPTTSSSTPPTTQIPPPPHATSSPLLYAVVVLVIAVAVLGFLLVRRR